MGHTATSEAAAERAAQPTAKRNTKPANPPAEPPSELPTARVAPSELDALADAVRALSLASQEQSAAMLSLATATAESVRLAAGSYVFQLRDRFDEMLPATKLGASEATWFVNDSPGPIDQLVFHKGDRARIELRLALSQAPIRRIAGAVWTDLPSLCEIDDEPRFSSSSGITRSDGRYQLDADVSMFVDLALAINIGDCEPGSIDEVATLVFDCTDMRPEGATSLTTVEIHIRALVVPDDDGIGLDIPTVDAYVREERRTYWLDKAEHLPLQLPRL